MDKLRANPGDAGILIQVGEEYMAAGDWERAAPFLRQAAQGGTPDARALSLLGICLFRQGRPEEAAESFEQALRLREDPIALYNLAILHRYHLNRPEPAEGLLRRALQSPESDADLLERVRRELGTN
jgi:Flp pilus assembly protein TadD